MSRPERYTENNSSRDWIDEFCATSSVEEVRGAFRFTIGKYLRRYGKKDDPLQEAIKIQDYANRLVAFERDELRTEREEALGLLRELRAFTLDHDDGRAGVLRGQIDAFLTATP